MLRAGANLQFSDAVAPIAQEQSRRTSPFETVSELLKTEVSEKSHAKFAAESGLLKVLTNLGFGGRKIEVLRSRRSALAHGAAWGVF